MLGAERAGDWQRASLAGARGKPIHVSAIAMTYHSPRPCNLPVSDHGHDLHITPRHPALGCAVQRTTAQHDKTHSPSCCTRALVVPLGLAAVRQTD